jgi:hypothetical protein
MNTLGGTFYLFIFGDFTLLLLLIIWFWGLNPGPPRKCSTALLFLFCFQDKVLLSLAKLAWNSGTQNSPASTSQVAGIARKCHYA